MNSLCNIYVRFLPKLRSLYQQYSKIQWADDPTITALRMVGYWRFLQDKGTILDYEFSLTDADKIIQWKLEKPSESVLISPIFDDATSISEKSLTVSDLNLESIQNSPLESSPDPFATLFLYQLFESLVRIAHHKLAKDFPDSLILQVTRFLENFIFIDDAEIENEYSLFRKEVSTVEFDDLITQFSFHLLKFYLNFSGWSHGCSRVQASQLSSSWKLDQNVDVCITEFRGIMTVRDFILFLGNRKFFDDYQKLSVIQVLMFLKFGSLSAKLSEEKIDHFQKFYTSFMSQQITLVEFIQSLAFVANLLIPFNWDKLTKFRYLIEHIDNWVEPVDVIEIVPESA